MVEETKLLGIVITSDLRWEANTSYICRKVFKKMWILTRLKVLDVPVEFLVDVYKKEVRSVVEIAVPSWHSGLTVKQGEDIERVQKVAMSVILGQRMPSVEAKALLGIESLHDRREVLCKRFARKTLQSRHSDIFDKNIGSKVYQPRFKQPFYENKCNTKRYYDSPINYLTRLLNSQE